MKRKFYSQKEMSELRRDKSIVFAVNKRFGNEVYVTHWNVGDIVHTYANDINKKIKIERNKKKSTRKVASKNNCVHFGGKSI